MSTQKIVRDIPKDQVQQTILRFKASGATDAVSEEQIDGNYSVMATFPDDTPPPGAIVKPQVIDAPAALFQQKEIPAPSTLSSFVDLAAEYRMGLDTCEINPGRTDEIDLLVKKLLSLKSRYDAIAKELKIPWYFIAVIHRMESDNNFNTHLHNGDPLTARTVQKPPGRPLTGSPPFAWEDSARDALTFEGFADEADWSVERMLFRLESYNGMGYRSWHIWSPYLWGYTNFYIKGHFIADGKFDPDATAKRCGAALLIRQLMSK